VLVGSVELVRAKRAEEKAVKSANSEVKARGLSEQRLYEAKLEEARAKRLSGVAGQRFESLAAISEAARIRRSPELSDEALACLALTDLRVRKSFQLPSRWSAELARFDDRLELYAYETVGGISVRRVSNDEETAFLPVKEANPAVTALEWFRFDPTDRYLSACFGRYPFGQFHWHVWDLSRRGTLVLDEIGDYLAFSPDGRALAIAREDGTLSLRECESWMEVRRLKLATRLREFCFSPDGTQIAVFEEGSGTVGIYAVSTGELLVSLLNSEKITAMAWNRDGSLLAAGDKLGAINLWDVRRGELHARLDGHRAVVCSLAFDHAGTLLASGAWDGTTRLWDVVWGQQLVVYASAMSQLRFAPDDKTLAGTFDGSQCNLLEVTHPRGYRRLKSQFAADDRGVLDFSSDGRLMAAASRSGVCLLDLANGQDLGYVDRIEGTSVHFDAATGPDLYSATPTGLHRWLLKFGSGADANIVQVRLSESLPPAERLYALAFDRTERRVAATMDGSVILMDLLQRGSPARFCPQAGAAFVTIDPSGHWVASGTWKHEAVKVWEFSTGRLMRDLPVSGSANVAASPDGKWLATANDTEYRLWDTASWSPLPQVIHADPVRLTGEMAFSPDGRLLATCHEPGLIQIVQVPTLQIIGRILLPVGTAILALRFSPDGTKLAAAETSGGIHLWDLGVIRSELKNVNLDWDLPPFRPIHAGPSLLDSKKPIRLVPAPFISEELGVTIPPREASTPANLIDLSQFYNAPLTASWHGRPDEHNDLSELPHGLQTFAGVMFDVRGLIQLGARAATGLAYPNHVLGIPIGRSCQRLHFLHAAVSSDGARRGDELGSYIIHYIDGRRVEIPIVVGKDLADWWSQADQTNMNFVIAWTGRNPCASWYHRTIRLFKTTWENPRPAVRIRQFDFVSDKLTPGKPFLVALTAEP
jgi:WD40 repeat protein